MKVLIIDDGCEVRRVMRQYLAGLAAEIREVEDGVKAVPACRSFHPDWVLMDLAMEHTDGISATKQLQAIAPGLKILIVTNHDEAVLREAAREAAACAYVLKENLHEVRRLLSEG